MPRRLVTSGVVFAIVLAAFLTVGHTSPRVSAAPGDIESRVDSILSQMTLEEKVDMLGGVDDFYIRGVERLHVPRFKMADGPIGVRNYGPSTAMAGGIALTATWNPGLAERVGTEIGRDARAKGVHFMLGPGVNIYRAPRNSRNFEYFGEDPFLASRIAVGYIQGVQSQGVSSTVKHFMGNNSEFLRHDSDSVIDERTMREIYLPVFEAAVKEAHVGAIMDSYNSTNGQHMTQNGYLNIEVAKKEWGFDGIIVSDWVATYDAVGAANGGLDLEMPKGLFLNRQNLLPAVQQGKVSVATIDDKVRRILRTGIRFGWLDRDQLDLSIPRYNLQGRAAALQAAREGIVLLKNDGNLLPLSKGKLKSIAIIGPDAYPAQPVGGGSARVEPFSSVSFLEGISNALGTTVSVGYRRGIPSLQELASRTKFSTAESGGEAGLRGEYFDNVELRGNPVVVRTDTHISFSGGARATFPDNTQAERWTGYYTPERGGAHTVFVENTGEDGGFYRLYVDDKLLFDNWNILVAMANHTTLSLDARPHKVVLEHHGKSGWHGLRLFLGIAPLASIVDPEALAIAAKADAVVVAAGFDPETECEGSDRTFSLPPGQDELIQELAAANKNTIVVITSGGSVDASSWAERVPAMLEAWYPGQEGGTALAEILLGDVNPSGRLPISWERKWEDNPVHNSYYMEPGTNKVVYKEGVFVGYRGYEHSGTKPLFPFGFGLSYTTFTYRNLSVKPIAGATATDPLFEVSFDVINTGSRAGADVPEVYVGEPHAKVPRPPKELKGFSKVYLQPGETKHVTVTLDRRALSYYDASAKQWRADSGDFDVLVGRSSQQIELRGTLTLAAGQ